MSPLTEKPSAASAPAEKPAASREKEALQPEFLEIEKQIRDVSSAIEPPAFPPAFVPAKSKDIAERNRLSGEWKKLTADPRGDTERSLVVLRELAKSNPGTALQRAKLILDLLTAYSKDLQQYRLEHQALEKMSINAASAALTVPADDVRTILAGPPRLPREEPVELNVWQQRLEGEWRELAAEIGAAIGTPEEAASVDAEAVRTRIAEYLEDARKYEAACKTFGKERFKAEFGFPPDMTDEEIQQFLADIIAPLPRPQDAKKQENKTDATVQTAYEEIERARLEMSRKLPLFLLHGFTDSLKDKVVGYIMKREVYEQKVLERPSVVSSWALYMGIAVNELGEEVLESAIGWPDKLFGLDAKDLRLFSPAARLKIINGWKDVSLKLAAKGIPVESLGSVLRTLNKSPIGPAFWSELMTIESPATVLLWAYYMHTSDDKLKACVQFGSFIALSGLSNKAVGSMLTRMGIGLKTPGVPYVKIVVALILAFVASEKINDLSTWADTKLWPDSPLKQEVMTALGFIGADAAFGQGYETVEAMGLVTLNPEQDMDSFFKRQSVLPDYEKGVLDQSYYQTVDAWNGRVDAAIAAEKNPIRKKLWEEEKITDPLFWGERMSVRLYAQVSRLKAIEDDKAFWYGLAQKGLIQSKADLNALDLATSDTGDLRNDRVLGNALGSGPLSHIRTYMEGGAFGSRTIAGDSDLLPLWEEYKSLAQQVAKSVSIYRHLGIYPPETGRTQWLGDIRGEKMPVTPQVERGLVEEIAYRNRRQRAISSSTHSALENRDYAERVIESVPFVDTQSFFQWLNLAESHTDEQTEDLNKLKTFVRLNAKYFHGRELDRVLQPFTARAASGERATYEDLEGVYTRMSDFLMERSLKETTIKPLPASVLEQLRISVPLAFEQRGVFAEENINMLKRLEQNKEFVHSMYADCLVMRSVEYSSFIRVECFLVYGNSPDRNKWRISEISTIMPRMLERGKRVYDVPQNSISRSIPYEEWMKAHPDDARRFAVPLDALEKANRLKK